MAAHYYVSILVTNDQDFEVYKKMTFTNKKKAIAFAKDYLEGTDGSAAVQIVGQDDHYNWIYSKTYVAVNHKAKAL